MCVMKNSLEFNVAFSKNGSQEGFFFQLIMLTFAIVVITFNLFRLTQNRSCFGYVFKNFIY